MTIYSFSDLTAHYVELWDKLQGIVVTPSNCFGATGKLGLPHDTKTIHNRMQSPTPSNLHHTSPIFGYYGFVIMGVLHMLSIQWE